MYIRVKGLNVCQSKRDIMYVRVNGIGMYGKVLEGLNICVMVKEP